MLDYIILLITTILAAGMIYMFFVIFFKGLISLIKKTPHAENEEQIKTKKGLINIFTEIFIIIISLMFLIIASQIIFFIIVITNP